MADRAWKGLIAIARRRQEQGDGWIGRAVFAAGALACVVCAFDRFEGAHMEAPGSSTSLFIVVATLFAVPIALVVALSLRLAQALRETMQRGDDA